MFRTLEELLPSARARRAFVVPPLLIDPPFTCSVDIALSGGGKFSNYYKEETVFVFFKVGKPG